MFTYTYFKKRRDEKNFKIRSKVTRIYFNMHKGYPNSFKDNTVLFSTRTCMCFSACKNITCIMLCLIQQSRQTVGKQIKHSWTWNNYWQYQFFTGSNTCRIIKYQGAMYHFLVANFNS